MDFKQYQKEFYNKTNNIDVAEVLTHYEYPNKNELHNMICGYSYEYKDKLVFDYAESIDYLKYERNLWKNWRRN